MPSPPDDTTTNRRRLLAAVGALAVGAGCSTATAPGEPSPAASPTPTDSPTSPSDDGDRPTMTPREPRPLDATGAWRQRGFDAGHSGTAPDATGVPDDGAAYWHLRRIRSGPAVVADGRLFHYAEVGVGPDDPRTVTPTAATPSTAGPDFPTQPTLVCRDAADGRIRWSRALRGPAVRWPAVADGRVYVGVEGQLAAYRAADGAVVWDRDFGDRILGDPTVAGDALVVPVQGVADGERTIREPGLRVHERGDGRPRWTVDVPKRGNRVAVDADSGTVVLVSYDYDRRGTVVGRSLADGERRWRRETPGAFFEGPVVAGGVAVIAEGGGGVVAYDAADGRERWSRVLDGSLEGIASDGSRVYAGTSDGLVARRLDDGRRAWAVGREGRGTPFTTPAVAGDTLYVGGGELPEAHLAARAASDGSERWRVPLPETVVGGDMVTAGLAAQPAVVDGGVYAFAEDGLYAVGPSSE